MRFALILACALAVSSTAWAQLFAEVRGADGKMHFVSANQFTLYGPHPPNCNISHYHAASNGFVTATDGVVIQDPEFASGDACGFGMLSFGTLGGGGGGGAPAGGSPIGNDHSWISLGASFQALAAQVAAGPSEGTTQEGGVDPHLMGESIRGDNLMDVVDHSPELSSELEEMLTESGSDSSEEGGQHEGTSQAQSLSPGGTNAPVDNLLQKDSGGQVPPNPEPPKTPSQPGVVQTSESDKDGTRRDITQYLDSKGRPLAVKFRSTLKDGSAVEGAVLVDPKGNLLFIDAGFDLKDGKSAIVGVDATKCMQQGGNATFEVDGTHVTIGDGKGGILGVGEADGKMTMDVVQDKNGDITNVHTVIRDSKGRLRYQRWVNYEGKNVKTVTYDEDGKPTSNDFHWFKDVEKPAK